MASYQNYEGLDQLQTTLRFLPAGVSGCKYLFLHIYGLS
jgi:hypothetical protein